MTGVIAILLLVSPQGAGALTDEDISREKFNAYRALTEFSETWLIEIKEGSSPAQKFNVDRFISGAKHRLVMRSGAHILMEFGYDGAKRWAVLHDTRKYMIKVGVNDIFGRKYEPPKYDSLADNYFYFNFLDPYDIAFISKPQLRLTKFDADARVATSLALRPDTGATVDVIQTFYPGKWILTKFTVKIRDSSNTTTSITGMSGNQSFFAGNKDSRFALSAAISENYTLVPWVEPTIQGG